MTTIKRGIIKRVVVNQHKIRANRKHGTHEPVISIQTSRGPVPAGRVRIDGPSEVVYRPQKPLSCGAHVWVETKAEVQYTR